MDLVVSLVMDVAEGDGAADAGDHHFWVINMIGPESDTTERLDGAHSHPLPRGPQIVPKRTRRTPGPDTDYYCICA